MASDLTTQEAARVFALFSSAEKQEFLARFAHELTILMRDCYEVGSDSLENPQRARLINEVQHRVLKQLHALLINNSIRFPDDVLINIILEQPHDENLARQMRQAFARSTAHQAVTS